MTKHILITGASGFIGQELAAALLHADPTHHLTLTDVVAPKPPPTTSPDRITTTQTDLSSPTAAADLLSSQPHWHAIYTLHGIMSAGSEANLALGYAVNLDSHRHLYSWLIAHRPGTTVIFTSSTAVYGPPSTAGGPTQTFTERTMPLPQSSYGTQKFVVECLLNDYARRGLLDARIVRLPTVVVRPGAPTAAASSFASGIVREPLNGERAVLPVDKALLMWVCSPATVVRNLVAVKDVPAARFEGLMPGRTVNLPGVTVRIAEILEALEEVGGKEARALVDEKVDEATERIVKSWPERFDVERAVGLGLVRDGPLIETVRAYAESLKR